MNADITFLHKLSLRRRRCEHRRGTSRVTAQLPMFKKYLP